MSEIIKKIEFYYEKSDGTLASDLSAVESFRGHTSDGKHFVGAYIHDVSDSGSSTFHLFEVCFLENMFQVATFKYGNYIKATLVDLENTCRTYTDSTFTLDEVADNLSFFLKYLENGC